MTCLDVRLTTGSVTLYSHPPMSKNFYLLLNPDEVLTQLRVSQDSVKLQAGHGVEAGLPTYGPRTLPLSIEIHAEDHSTLLSMESALVNEFLLPYSPSYSGNDGAKLIQIQDEDGSLKQIYAVPTERVQGDILPDRRQNRRTFTVALFAEDPLLYGQNAKSINGSESFDSTTWMFQDGDLPTLQDGALSTIQDAVGADLTVTNTGNIGTPAVFTITGPTTNPVITNTTTGKKIALTKNGGVSLLAGETITIDVAAQTIIKTVSGVETDVSGTYSDDSQWIVIEPEDNKLTMFDDTSGVLSGNLAVTFRDAWV